jgi:hypothetical protein
VIPHPLTLLLGYLLGTSVSEGLGYILQFIGELCADARRFGAIGDHVFAVAMAGLGFIATFSGGFFIGAAMRLFADDSWPKAALWALMTSLIIGLINSSVPMRMYPAVGLALATSPRYVLLMPLGALAGAYTVDHFKHDHRVQAAREMIKGFMVWEH